MPPREPPFLTVILAVKDPEAAQFDVCLASIAALHNSSRVNLVVVVSGPFPAMCNSVAARLQSVRVVTQEAQGIYQAYNRGLDEVSTPYVMVIGCDDILLPGLDCVIDSIADTRRPHLVAACAFVQGAGIMRPSRFRWGLILGNWCQQGLLYRSDIFVRRRFDCKYPIQADHKLNMELVSDRATAIEYRDEVICHFASNGLSQRVHDCAFREDMPGLVREYYGLPFGIVALTRRHLADVFKGRRRLKEARL